MAIATDLIDRLERLSQKRLFWSQLWYTIAGLVHPSESVAASFHSIIAGIPSSTPFGTGPNSTQRVKNIYDNTGMMCVDRLAAGMESLVTPQSEKWHGLSVEDIEHGPETQEEKIYLERLRNFQFQMRYDPRAGFTPAHQKAMRSCIAFGTGIKYLEEGGRARPGDPPTMFRYSYAPLTECMLDTNTMGVCDTNFRVRNMTVKQVVGLAGPKRVSQTVRNLWDKGLLDQNIPVLHAVCPREEVGSGLLSQTVKGSALASYYLEIDQKHLITDSGYFEFPYSVYHWLQQDNGPYAESAVMLALSEIKSLQAMGKSELRAFAQWTDPPLGMVNDGVMNRPSLNPRAINMGAIGPGGEKRVAPILTAQNPDFAEKVMEARRHGVKETLYVNLFQILVQNPKMSATEAMLRANEKGELLGPAGGKIQAALATECDRELAILTRKGIFKPSSKIAPPQSLAGRSINVRFTSPLDRLRRANEAVGAQRLLEMVLPVAKVKPQVLDKFDFDGLIDQLREILGAPAMMLVTESVLAARRKASDAQAQQAKTLMAGQAAGGIAKDASVAGRNMGEVAMQSPEMMSKISELLDRLRGGVQGNPQATPQQVDTTNALMGQFGKPPVATAA